MELNFTPSLIKRLLYLILVTGLAFTAYIYSNNSQSYWVVWAALSFSLVNIGSTFRHRVDMICLLGFATALACFFAGYLALMLPAIAIYLFIVTMINVILSQRYPEYFFGIFIVSLFAIIASGLSLTLNENIDRVVFILTGTTIAAIFQIIFWPGFIKNEIRSWTTIALSNLELLNTEIFSCFLQPTYTENIYLFERRLHKQKESVMQALFHLRNVVQQAKNRLSPQEKNRITEMIAKIDRLFDIMMDYAQLRARVTDHTIFEICKEELIAVSQSMAHVFSELKMSLEQKKQELNIIPLKASIKRLEENYQNVVQVTAREPLVFFLFIASLNAFTNEVEKIAEVSQGI